MDLSVLANASMALALSAHAPWVQLGSSYSNCRRAELGKDTHSRYLAEHPQFLLSCLNEARLALDEAQHLTRQLDVIIEHPGYVFPPKMQVELPRLATAKWSNQKYGKQTQV